MISYFSGTGNSEYVARRIAEATNEEYVNIADCEKQSRFRFHLKKKERLGFVIPTYYWGMPALVEDFIKKMEILTEVKHYTYCVATFGTVTGGIAIRMSKFLKKKGFPLHACFAIRMVDTYTPLFDLRDKAKNMRENAKTETFIYMMMPKIVNRVQGDFNKNKGLFYKASPLAKKAYNKARKTRKFKVKDNCIGCGRCADFCPECAITMQDGKPVWTKKKCSLCLGCLHRCPQAAILYGTHTEHHGQYVNPNVVS